MNLADFLRISTQALWKSLDSLSYESKTLLYISNLGSSDDIDIFLSSLLPEGDLPFSMVKLGLFIGLFSLTLTLLGFLSILTAQNIWFTTIVFILIAAFLFRHNFDRFKDIRYINFSKHEKILLGLLVVASIVNLWGVLVPETAFDSLWYHLTIPRLYLERGEIYPIPGGLLYYSGFPKLVEILYFLPLSLGNEIGAKAIHFIFGIFCLISVTVVAKDYLSRKYVFLVPVILASSLVFAWESTVAFNDLVFAFYEILAFYSLTKYVSERKFSWIIILGLMLGFAVMAKLIAVLSVVIYLILLIFVSRGSSLRIIVKLSVSIAVLSLLPSFPWFVFNEIYFGNAIYPFGSEYLNAEGRLFTGKFASFIENVFFAPDPISPVYLIFLPFAIAIWKMLSQKLKLVFYYTILTFVFWLLISGTGGSRFLLPFLPVYSIAVGLIVEKMTVRLGKSFYSLSFLIISFFLVVCIVYRVLAQADSFFYIVGSEAKSEYLTRKLNYSFGDFYDTDGYLTNYIDKNDLVLVMGSHNLFYVNFPFVHQSWYKGEDITHVLTQNTDIPEEFSEWGVVYSNPQTGTVLYKNPN